jgi:alkylated DNA repair protein (DNA oxidative demethylase)
MGRLWAVARGLAHSFRYEIGDVTALGASYIWPMELNGFRLFPAALTPQLQSALVDAVWNGLESAPLYAPRTPSGKSMSVLQSSFGPLGWVTDGRGYRYEPNHPVTGKPWPAMPPVLLSLWHDYAGPARSPDSCLINLYRDGARMGLHRDEDEAEFDTPVLSVSLGDTALFRIGGLARAAPTRSLRLSSGDICVLGGDSRRAYHGVDRIIAGSSRLVAGGGRINLTLRRAQI